MSLIVTTQQVIMQYKLVSNNIHIANYQVQLNYNIYVWSIIPHNLKHVNCVKKYFVHNNVLKECFNNYY